VALKEIHCNRRNTTHFGTTSRLRTKVNASFHKNLCSTCKTSTGQWEKTMYSY